MLVGRGLEEREHARQHPFEEVPIGESDLLGEAVEDVRKGQ